MARGRLGGRLLLAGGAVAVAVLIAAAGYPASAVGVPGDARSNLAPPSLAAVALAVAQVGAVLAARRRLGGLLASQGRWRPVAAVNQAAFPVYLCHQSVLIAVVAGAAWAHPSPVPGLQTAPADPVWVAQRAAWLPVLTLVLFLVVRTRAGAPRSRGPRPPRPAPPERVVVATTGVAGRVNRAGQA